MKRLSLILALLASACTIDPGGDVRERAKMIATADPGVLPDVCLSACLMGLRIHCVKPTAVLVFHGPQSRTPLTADVYEQWVDAIANYYPKQLGEWYRATGHTGLNTMTGKEAIAMGARPCAPTPATT